MTLLYSLDMLGTFAFAVSGALAGVRKEMDIYGISFLAVITAVGGGTTRDVLMGRTPPFVFVDYNYIYISVFAAFLVFMFHKHIAKTLTLLIYMDALGLGVFNIIGISVGLNHGIGYLGSIALGVMTGTGGGMMRDVLTGETPFVLKREIYASACILGGASFIAMELMGINRPVGLTLSAVIVILIRVLAIIKDWNLPKAV